jgi:hypothetical protein
MRLFSFVAISVTLLALSPQLYAQASPSCPMQPRTIRAMRSCYRPLLVFSRSASDPRFLQQERAMDSDADDMMDRNVLLVPILKDASTYKAPLDAPRDLLPQAEQKRLRGLYRVPSDRFRVILLGEDGGVKMVRDQPIPMRELNALIDTMPTRKLEMQEPNTN